MPTVRQRLCIPGKSWCSALHLQTTFFERGPGSISINSSRTGGFTMIPPLKAWPWGEWLPWHAKALWPAGQTHKKTDSRGCIQNLPKKRQKNQNRITLQEFAWHSKAHKTTSWEDKSFTEVTGDIAAQNELTISLQQMGYLLFLNRALVLKQQWYLYCTPNHKSRKVVS